MLTTLPGSPRTITPGSDIRGLTSERKITLSSRYDRRRIYVYELSACPPRLTSRPGRSQNSVFPQATLDMVEPAAWATRDL
jgi:hypothetical protein